MRIAAPVGTLASAPTGVYFLPSGEFSAGCRGLGAHPRIQADLRRGDGYVSAYDACRIDRCIRRSRMSLGPLMVDIAGTTLSAEDARVLSHPLVGGVVLFTRNYVSPRQGAALNAAIRGL